MAMEITAMSSLPTPKPSLPSPSTLPHTITTFSKPQLRRISLPTSTTISLLTLFTPPNEARAAVNISKDQIVSSLTQVKFFFQSFKLYQLPSILHSCPLTTNAFFILFRWSRLLIRFRWLVLVFWTQHNVLLKL